MAPVLANSPGLTLFFGIRPSRDASAGVKILTMPVRQPSFPSDFVPLAGTPRDCEDCGKAERVGFQFDYAFQPIVDVQHRSVFAHEALVRGPKGEGAMSVLVQVNDHNRYRFDQACRVKAIKAAAELGIAEPISINFLPNAIYKPELCIRTTLEAARVHGFPLEHIIFEVTEGERIEDGPWGLPRSCANTNAAASRPPSTTLAPVLPGSSCSRTFSPTSSSSTWT